MFVLLRMAGGGLYGLPLTHLLPSPLFHDISIPEIVYYIVSSYNKPVDCDHDILSTVHLRRPHCAETSIVFYQSESSSLGGFSRVSHRVLGKGTYFFIDHLNMHGSNKVLDQSNF